MDVHLMSEQRDRDEHNKEQRARGVNSFVVFPPLRREILKFTTPVNHLLTFNSTANEYLKTTLK
jgi:hypothetical protein